MHQFSENSPFAKSEQKLRLLCLSNGHGEDMIAVRILQELQQYPNSMEIAALPIVGVGLAYTQLEIPIIGSVQTMPSGGFIHMDGWQLVQDLRYGLLGLSLSQLRAVRSWARQGGAILAVGDIVPLLFAWLSGARYAFVGTAKSEYYLRDEQGWLAERSRLSRWEGWSGSIYLPWERWLMSLPRCQAVFPRDSLTTKTLQKWSIPAFDLGNPMMDRLEPSQQIAFKDLSPDLTIVLLPGSRAPEAYANWQQILLAVAAVGEAFADRSVLFLGAIAPSLSLEPLCQILLNSGFSHLTAPNALTFKHKNVYIILSQTAYNECLHRADLAIAMAGTATEQFVGLGKPAIAIPGKGPQFTPAFAEAQSRLLGKSLIVVKQPSQVGDMVKSLLSDRARLNAIAENGARRMGEPGAARRIAACLMEKFGQTELAKTSTQVN